MARETWTGGDPTKDVLLIQIPANEDRYEDTKTEVENARNGLANLKAKIDELEAALSTSGIFSASEVAVASVGTPTDITADGGGLRVKGATDKTILWDNSDDSFHSSEPIVVDGAGDNSFDGNVGIGTTSPDTNLHVVKTATGQTARTQSLLTVDNTNDNVDITILSDNDQSGRLVFGDTNDNDVGMISYNHIDNSMYFRANGAEQMYIDANGNVGIKNANPSQRLEIGTFSET